MTKIPTQRQERILDWLQERHSLSIDELMAHFGVSIMTIHRDLDALAQLGLVEKVHGGVMRAKLSAPDHNPTCKLCTIPTSPRTRFVVQNQHGESWYACCPHCAWLLIPNLAEMQSAQTVDFLYGRLLNAFEAVYLVGSQITLCCLPNILSFATWDDATNFQKGFGGELLSFADLPTRLQHVHPPPSLVRRT